MASVIFPGFTFGIAPDSAFSDIQRQLSAKRAEATLTVLALGWILRETFPDNSAMLPFPPVTLSPESLAYGPPDDVDDADDTSAAAT